VVRVAGKVPRLVAQRLEIALCLTCTSLLQVYIADTNGEAPASTLLWV
jgi:hypothetical protein